MCELFGLSSERKIRINEMLETFFSHSVEHRNGWGLALLDKDQFYIEKEPIRAIESTELKKRLKKNIEASRCLAHIRKATIGEIDINNTHPFSRYDNSHRLWILIHNGTIFDSEILRPYQFMQEGSTDSERILLFLVDRINKCYAGGSSELSMDVRIKTVDEAVKAIVPGNKVNLMIYDGELLYVHINEAGTLFEKNSGDSIIFSTRPLDSGKWSDFPLNRLMVYSGGKLLYTGDKHRYTYIYDEEKMKPLFLTYSGL